MKKPERKSGILTWSSEDRPREKLVNKGKNSLTNAELIAILIGSGSVKESAVDLAKRILTQMNDNLIELSKSSIEDLQRFKGIGQAKAITIAAALELGKRRREAESLERPSVRSSADAHEILQSVLSDLDHEEIWILAFNQKNRLIRKICISVGGISMSSLDLKVVFRHILQVNATSFILAHNHPSGSPEPSNTDDDITKKMVNAAKIMDVRFLDHIIVGEEKYYSFADEGKLNFI